MDQELTLKKKELVKHLIDKDVLVSGELLEDLKAITTFDELERFMKEKEELSPKEKKEETEQEGARGTVRIAYNYDREAQKRSVQDFVSYFNSRLNALKNLLMQRQELQGTISISRLKTRTEKETVSLIGLIKSKRETPNGHIMLELEDNTGVVKVLINKNKPNLLTMMKDAVFDEVIGVVGVSGDNIVFANNVILPDVPITKEFKKSPDEGYALFTTCMHFGSKLFLEEEFRKFINWLKGETGSEAQKKIARSVKYLFLLGDLVEGVGIYPNQENDLEVEDITDQYRGIADMLAEIPNSVQIIVSPGNHDAVRIEEPQPVMDKEMAKPLWDLPNITMVSNPAIVNIDSSERFSGFDVLLYHGFSFIYYSESVPTIRTKGGQKRSDLIMKFLLQRRHLAPAHTSTLYLPDPEKDPMVIDKVPDIFATGHLHRAMASQYRNITTLCCSCFTKTSPYQIKLGIENEPSKVHGINLHTREVKIFNFNIE